LALLIKVLELKYVYIKAVEQLLDMNSLDNKKADLIFCAKNLQILDKYIKNVLLKLRLKHSYIYSVEDI
jgi:hypothetical protein